MDAIIHFTRCKWDFDDEIMYDKWFIHKQPSRDAVAKSPSPSSRLKGVFIYIKRLLFCTIKRHWYSLLSNNQLMYLLNSLLNMATRMFLASEKLLWIGLFIRTDIIFCRPCHFGQEINRSVVGRRYSWFGSGLLINELNAICSHTNIHHRMYYHCF